MDTGMEMTEGIRVGLGRVDIIIMAVLLGAGQEGSRWHLWRTPQIQIVSATAISSGFPS